MSAYTRLEFDGATATSILPTGERGSPGSVMRDQVAPVSRDTYTPLPGPPLNMAHVCMTTSHVPAKSTPGLVASIERPEQPVFSLTNSTRFHVVPPSVVRNTPRSSCGPVARPSAQTKTMLGFAG